MNRAPCARAISLGLTFVGLVTLAVVADAQETRRSVGAGALALELSGSQVGFLRGASGGEVRGDVASAPSSGSLPKKHIAAVHVEDLVLEVGAGMDKPIYDWIAASWQGTSTPMNGAVLFLSYDFKVVARKEFYSATVVEATVPELDAASKEPASLTVKLRPQSVKMVKGAGSAQSPPASNQKLWLPSNFRVEIPGLDCTRVKKIDALTLKMNPAKVPDLQMTIAEAGSETWAAWHKSFVIDGNNDESQEKNGAIVFFAPDMQTELGRITLFNMGIVGLSRDRLVSSGAIGTVKAQLYCERMALQWNVGASPGVLNTRTFLR